jgi:hypothetical protein
MKVTSMTKPASVNMYTQRKVHTYSHLWHASQCVLSIGLQNEKGSTYQFLSSAILTAFTFEAYLNHVGAILFNVCDWEAYERLSPLEKFERLDSELMTNFSRNYGERPLQTIKKLLDFRNTIAHGKTSEHTSTSQKYTVKNYPAQQMPLSNWEKLIKTSAFACQVREDVKKVLEILHVARTDEKEHLFDFEISVGGVTLLDQP